PSDGAGHEVLVFGENEPVPWNAVTLAGATVTVNAGLAAIDDLFNVDEDSVNFSLDVLDNDTNEIGGEVTISQVGATSDGGTVTIASDGKSLLYSPAANFVGEETFTYTISNGGLVSTGEVTVQVAPVNDAPTAVDDAVEVDADSSGNFLDVLGNDLIAPDDNETLRVTSVGSTNHGGTVTIGPNGTHLLYTPAAGFTGTETFTYTIRDRASTSSDGLTSQATVTVTVQNVVRPNAIADTATVSEDSTSNQIDVLDNDSPLEPGAGLTVIAITQSKNGGTVSIAQDGSYVLYTPSPDFFGTDTFTYTIEEENGGQATASVTVTVNGTNDPPTANNDTFQVSKDAGATTLNVLANDTILPDANETLTVVAVTQGSQGGTIAIAADGKSVIYTQSGSTSLPDTYTETFTYTIGDGSGETDVATVSVTVRPYVPRDIGGIVVMSDTLAIGGLEVNLEGLDDFNGTVSLAYETMSNGMYTFGDLAPGSYTVKPATAAFLQQRQTELAIDSGDADGDSLNNNFTTTARDPAFISIADFLARAPRQSTLSPQNSVLVAAAAGGQHEWYSYQSGWQDYMQLQAELSSDAKQLTLKAVDGSGQQYQGTVSVSDSHVVKHLGKSGNSYLFRIDAGPQELNLQPVAASNASGEGESSASAVVEYTPAVAAAEGEASPAPALTRSSSAAAEPVAAQASVGDSIVAAAPVAQAGVGVDLVTPTVTTGSSDAPEKQAVEGVQRDSQQAIDAVWSAEGSTDEIEQPEFELIGSSSDSGQSPYALAIDVLLASNLV
ncbi:MAG: Ig-like domain-containing protein, partial [Planctomycetes bacterium]|nr:Ig-like domain-containing protein [Planctomycetota bacterium]